MMAFELADLKLTPVDYVLEETRNYLKSNESGHFLSRNRDFEP